MHSTTFTIPLRPVRSSATLLTPSGRDSRVTMEVSVSPVETLIVPKNHYLILVEIDPVGSGFCRVNLPSGTCVDLVREGYSVCLLPPKTSVTQTGNRSGKWLRYLIPQSSLQMFADRWGKTESYLLDAPRFAEDEVLQLLSRVMKRLLTDTNNSSENRAVTRYFTWTLFSHILTLYASGEPCKPCYTGGLSPRHKNLIETTLASPAHSKIAMADLADLCGLSPGYFARAFRLTFGASVHKHLVNIRMEQAMQLLAVTDMPLREIARNAGYADQTTFAESFKKNAGISPGRFRRQYSAAVSARLELRPNPLRSDQLVNSVQQNA